jgi:glucan phosphorylase
MILNSQRVSRLIQQEAVYKNQLTLNEVITQLVDQTFKLKESDSYHKSINEINQSNLFKHLMLLSTSNNVYPQVRAEIFNSLEDLLTWLKNNPEVKYSKFYQNQINQFMSQPKLLSPLKSEKIPDGSPIGSIACDF